jgi:hypothetical protein
LETLKSIFSSPSEEDLVTVEFDQIILHQKEIDSKTLGQEFEFNIELQKMQVICWWNIGNYNLACKLFSDLIIYSGKDISEFLKIDL